MKRHILLSVFVLLGLVAFAQSPLKTVSFHKNPDEIVDFRELKEKAGRDSDLDGNKAARIRVKAQGFDEKKMLDFTVFPRPGMEVIYKEFQQGEMWVYVSSKVQGTLVIKYMGEFEFKLPNKLEPKCGYDLVLGMETATLVISTIPSDAEIFVDGKKVGTGYGSAAISVGSEHRYKVSRDYYIPEEDVVKSDEAVKITKQIELRPNFSYITIKTEPSGAEIYIDGKKVGTTPYLSEMIEFGRRRVELKKSGYEPYVKVVTIKPEEEENTLLSNVKLEAVRVPMGSLDLSSNPTGAVITINGRQYGQTPKTLTDLEVGTYTVYFSKEGYQNLSQTVTVKDGKKETLSVTMTKASVPQQPVPTTPVATSGTASGTSTTTASGNRTFTINGVSFEMVAVKGGTFTMGGTSEQGSEAEGDEKPTHSVTLSDYYIGKFEVTQELWKAVMGNEPTYNGGWTDQYGRGNNYPAYRVSWNDIQKFIRKLNQKTGANFRLPTEAEWEYAARGGNKSNGYKYSGSNSIDNVAWYTSNSGSKTHQVGIKSPNELGIYDMSGNVWEWCQDRYGSYSSGSQTNPTGPSSGSYRVPRGGSWFNSAGYCRVSNRDSNTPDGRYSGLGFRLVLVP